MIDKRIGKRIKECRERLGLTQEQFAEKVGLTQNYVSSVERGAAFPRCERLIDIINGLQTSADSIFCDVVDYSSEYKSSKLSTDIATLPIEAQTRILNMIELMIQQEKQNKKG